MPLAAVSANAVIVWAAVTANAVIVWAAASAGHAWRLALAWAIAGAVVCVMCWA